MRICKPGLLFFFGLIFAGTAFTSDQSQVVQFNAMGFDLLRQPSSEMDVDHYQLPKRHRGLAEVEAPRDQVCYMIRSYKVVSTERFSGANDPVETSICQPSSRFELKESDEPVEDSK